MAVGSSSACATNPVCHISLDLLALSPYLVLTEPNSPPHKPGNTDLVVKRKDAFFLAFFGFPWFQSLGGPTLAIKPTQGIASTESLSQTARRTDSSSAQAQFVSSNGVILSLPGFLVSCTARSLKICLSPRLALYCLGRYSVLHVSTGDRPMAERGELDLTGAKQNTGVWLVKVSFTLNEDLANIHDIGGKPASVSAPREHPFLLQSVGGQTLTVFTESSSDKLSLEGIVVQRAECRPAASENYMRLKRSPAQTIPQGIKFLRGDICHLSDVQRALQDSDISCVFHIASYSMLEREQRNQNLIKEVNVGGTDNVLQACFRRGAPRPVYISTLSSLEAKSSEMEMSPCLNCRFTCTLITHYSRARSVAEKKVLEANGSILEMGDDVLRTCTLRLAGIHRPGEQRHLPMIVSYIKRGLFRSVYGDPSSLVQFVHVDKLETSLSILSGLYNFQPFLTHTEVYKTDVTHYFSLEKAKKELGYEPQTFDLQEVAD
ncbi:Short-chain dehydrogenase/reductase family 42E member 1 [Fukomys damarensis]|uniref:Short-chain dehydrogenase/reductase family 42E member 1 n=1 Tax=Fukomys damarensis TaxID=885580 RepID=A0A091D6X3_FUKDA|nr:Short-chain dehydrogenase/reductase family 42E member 1 [Fukomys damarensis]